MMPRLEIEDSNQSEKKNHNSLSIETGGAYFRAIRKGCSALCRFYFGIEFIGFENVPQEGPFIVAPNHQSYLDPFWVSIPFQYPLRYMTWDRFVYMPIIGQFIKSLGAFPVKIDKSDRAALRMSLEHLKKGGTLMIFPEGGRTRTGEIMPFKPGVIRLAIEARVPIIPVTIIGGYQAYSAHQWLPRPRKVQIKYHPPLQLCDIPHGSPLKEYLLDQTQKLQAIVEQGESNL